MRLKSILLVSCLMISCSLASENQESIEIVNIKSVEKEIENITARSRLNFVKELFSENNDLKMTTPVGKSLYEGFYQKDLSFIKQEIGNRKDGERIKIELDVLGKIVDEKFKEKMSLADYNFIAYLWSNILIYKIEEPRTDFSHSLKQYNHEISFFEQYKKFDGWNNRLKFIASPHIIMSHISKTGGVPILVINEGTGFWVVENKKANAVHFLAVGTNAKLSYDYLKDENCSQSWYHDFEHWARTDYFGYPGRIIKVAHFRSVLKEKVTDETEKKKAALAFHYFFHESQESYAKIGEALKEKIDEFKKNPDEAYKIREEVGFHSKEMVPTNVKGAESIKLIIKGKSLEEQKKSFVDTLYEGYEILLKFADSYDSYK